MVVRFGRMGDFLVSIPAIWHLKRSNPNADITLITGAVMEKDYTSKVANYSKSNAFPWVEVFNKKLFDNVLYVNGLFSLHSLRSVVSIVVRRNVKSVYYLSYFNEKPFRLFLKKALFALISFWKLKWAPPLGGEAATEKSNLQAWHCLEIVGYGGELNLLVSDLAAGLKDSMRPAIYQNNFTFAKKWAAKTICVYPSSTYQHKRWPLENFAEIVRWLVSNGYHVILLGHQGEYEWNQKILELAVSTNVINLAGKTSFSDLLELFDNVLMLIGNDGGLMHLAAIKNLPSITIMSGVFRDPVWDPFGINSVVLRYPTECSNCLSEFYCPNGTSQCMEKISVDTVKRSFLRLISSLINDKGGLSDLK